MSEYLAMGGYAAFVWPAYGVVAAVLIGLFVAGRRFQRATEAELAGLQPARRRRDAANEGTGDDEA
jgi:heme exporter protein D